MPGLVPGIHVLSDGEEVVDGRDRPGHDVVRGQCLGLTAPHYAS
ncbi:ABC transporter [Tardiphaga alba]|uniref:ABC transporter n=1 Tax=Tardiphaga alba TaxID=340268 RepID=A0ABX8AGR7_9BRAD|nr:ABC transporter [Tardiphaga alba]